MVTFWPQGTCTPLILTARDDATLPQTKPVIVHSSHLLHSSQSQRDEQTFAPNRRFFRARRDVLTGDRAKQRPVRNAQVASGANDARFGKTPLNGRGSRAEVLGPSPGDAWRGRLLVGSTFDDQHLRSSVNYIAGGDAISELNF